MFKVWDRTLAGLACLIATTLPPFSILSAQSGSPSPPPAQLWQSIFARPDTIPAPADNPLTKAKVALGRRLYFDPRLSGDGTRSCATCHAPQKGYSDRRPQPLGRDGLPLKRNAPALWNLAWAPHFYWDGRAATLEDQARVPIEHPREMGGDFAIIVRRLRRDTAMQAAFAAAFSRSPKISEATILAAIASYERSLVSPVTRFDRWIGGEASALTKQEQRGFQLFTGRAGCLACHGGWRFTDDKFHDIGLATDDPGRSAIDGGALKARRFKTPGLRSVYLSAPYMHDGSKKSLDDVLAHYAGGFEKRQSLAPSLVKDLRLSTQERAELIAFLKTL